MLIAEGIFLLGAANTVFYKVISAGRLIFAASKGL